MAQFVYFTALLVLCGTGDSLETTTSPQQQNTGDTKDLCEKSISTHGFPDIAGSNGMPGMPGIPGPQGPQGRDGVKGQPGDEGSQGMLGQKGKKGNEGPHGKSGRPGMMEIKGARGTVGDQGIKGDKGEKGESVTSPSSAVSQTNWKQCPSGSPELRHHQSFEGYCENIPQGTVRVELWVGSCPSGNTLGEAYTGWESVSRIMIEEVSRPQS
ncbi:short-chain collagen C4-like [Orbicella faveolata]|uniref:short-chain collagen C4-like n=1 Tax=Orbicella faveolata TaxID=48498 RepID=UPI0009E452C8|nr:short-chain collagen C4-like [Orbicella faveolata]